MPASSMLFRTPVELPAQSPALSADTSVVLLGSCFAIHMGERLTIDLGTTRCCANPFGVLYNPRSIFGALKLLLAPAEDAENCLRDALFEGRDGLWHSWLFSTHFSHNTAEGALQRMRGSVENARRLLLGNGNRTCEKPPMLILTFGTDHHYRLTDSDGLRVVANCHKELPARFSEHTDDMNALTALFEDVFDSLQERIPGLQTVLTVSPYRYKKYGFHPSQLSKARLLLLCDAACKTHPEHVHYFPAYEILNDELRDYRFYDADMLHPSPQAVDYIAARFEEWCFDNALLPLAEERRKAHKRAQHRRISPAETTEDNTSGGETARGK